MTPDQIAQLPYRPCVGIMLVNAMGGVFVGQRRDRDSDAWQMPQGGIDAGEDAATAALRELTEETSITADLVQIITQMPDPVRYDLPADLVPNIWRGRYRGQEQTWFLLRFLGRDDQIDLATAHPEFSAWKWAAPADLVAGIVPFKRDVYARVLAAFQAHLG